MKTFIKLLLQENLKKEPILISVKYLRQLNNMITNESDKNILTNWINKGDGDKTKLSLKQYQLLKNIERGGQPQNRYGSKN